MNRVKGTARRVPRSMIALLAAVAGVALPAGPAHATGSIDDCIRDRVERQKESQLEARVECMKNAVTPTTSRGGGSSSPSDDSGGGTSAGLLLVAGLVGAAIGATAMAYYRRSQAADTRTAPPAAPAAAAGPPLGFPAPGGSPAPPAAAAAPDRSRALIVHLIDLTDRVPSQALRAEILSALERAGVHSIDVPSGAPFDPNTMRGVGSSTAPDPSWAGRVASTERPGFHDGPRVIRFPDVIVFTSAS